MKTETAFHPKYAALQTIIEAIADIDHEKYRREMMAAGYKASLDKYGNEIWSLEDWKQAEKEQHPCTDAQTADSTVTAPMEKQPRQTLMPSSTVSTQLNATTRQTTPPTRSDMNALPAIADISPLITEFAPQRNDFDEIRRQVLSPLYAIQKMQATINGKELDEQLLDWDTRAKAFIDAWEDKHGPILKRSRDAYQATLTFHNNMIEAAKSLRKEISERTSAYQLNVDRAVQAKRRADEQLQRQQAEAEKRAKQQELEDRAAEARKAAIAAGIAGNHDAEAEGKMEEERLKAEASEVAAQPPVPAAVSTTAIAERYRVQGQTGVKVYLRSIKTAAPNAAGAFLTWAARQSISITIPQGKRNVAILMLGGIEITVNFSGLRKSDIEIPGVEVAATIDTSNRRK